LARFEREAKLLAKLNHKNVATLHGLDEDQGQLFLVMELVEGETLADEIAKGAIPIDRAIPRFIQIAEGLLAAHEKGIVHRDLKPANIKMGADGEEKILDFGLAKALSTDEAPLLDSSQSPTRLRQGFGEAGTAVGAMMGTAGYMSPEQVRGEDVDQRSDIWAFGCVLYEALTGKPAFRESTLAETLAAILNREPEWSALTSGTPLLIRRLLHRCLQKDVRRRWQHAGDVRIELEEAASASDGAQAAALEPQQRRSPVSMTLVGVSITTVAFAAWSFTRTPLEPTRPVTRSVIPLAPGQSLVGQINGDGALAISPDGRTIAYLAESEEGHELYVRKLDDLAASRIEGTDGASSPFFSPDSNWLAFGTEVGRVGQVKKVALSGGAPVAVPAVGTGRGMAWSETGAMFFGSTGIGGALAPVGSRWRSTTDHDTGPRTGRESTSFPRSPTRRKGPYFHVGHSGYGILGRGLDRSLELGNGRSPYSLARRHASAVQPDGPPRLRTRRLAARGTVRLELASTHRRACPGHRGRFDVPCYRLR
jgi:serine/threonine-protein kinase